MFVKEIKQLRKGYDMNLWTIQDIENECNISHVTIRKYILLGIQGKLSTMEEIAKTFEPLKKKVLKKIESL